MAKGWIKLHVDEKGEPETYYSARLFRRFVFWLLSIDVRVMVTYQRRKGMVLFIFMIGSSPDIFRLERTRIVYRDIV
jgi:hypothetical protein